MRWGSLATSSSRFDGASSRRWIAANPSAWSHLVAFDSEERHYVSLHRDSHVDVWLLCWTPENDTGWHDHDVSSGAVAVVAGELAESNLTLMHGARERRVVEGEVFSFGPDHIHRMNGVEHGSVSVHVSPRPCGGWASTPSTRPACCDGSRCPTRTS